MKKLFALLLALAMLTMCAAFADEAPARTQDIVVMFTSDVHCGIDQNWGYVGLEAAREGFEAQGAAVLLVDNGDSIQGEPVGTMTTGEANIKLMNAMKYTAATMGNHEFDYGMDRFLELAAMAEFPYVSANFTHEGELVFDPYKMVEVDGVKIAFVGVTTPKTFTSSTPTYFQDENGNYVYGFCEGNDGQDLYDAVQKAADAAREEGADYVVVIAHLGIEAECAPWMSSDVIANTNGIDALLDGHSHTLEEGDYVKNKDGEDVLWAGCGTKLESISYITIGQDGKISSNSVPYEIKLAMENYMSAEVAAATEALNAKLNEVVAKSEVVLTIKDPATDARIIRNAETNLGDLCADAYRAMSGADVAFVNGGGIRVSINAGDITLNDILKVHPFGNALCVVEANGQQILDALEWTARNVPGENGGFLQVSGLTYEINTSVETTVTMDDKGNFTGVAGARRIQNVKVAGEPIDPEKTYTVASHNYMLKSGGDGTNMFQNCTVLVDESMLDNQVLINYITDTLGGVVGEQYADPYGEGRIVAVTE